MIKKRYHMSQYAIANIRIPLQIVGDNYELLNDRIHIEFEKCTHLPDIQENVDNVSEQIKLLLLFTHHQTPSEVTIHESSDEIDDKISEYESVLEEKEEVKENDDDDGNKKYILHVKPTIPRNRLNITFKRKQSNNNITQKKYHS